MQNSVGNNTELEKKKSVDYYLTIIFPPLNHLTPQHVSMVEEKLNLCEHFLKRKLASCVSLSFFSNCIFFKRTSNIFKIMQA